MGRARTTRSRVTSARKKTARKKAAKKKAAPSRPKRSTRSRAEEYDDPVTTYAREVDSGKVIAGPYIRSACQRHLRDIAKYGDEPSDEHLWFDAKAANKVIGFFPIALRHAKGEWGGGDCIYCGMTGLIKGKVCEPCEGNGRRPPMPFELSNWQKFVVGSIMGWKRPNGLRRYRTAYVEIPRKNGKTTLAAGLALWFAFFDGETGAEAYCAATKRDQAKIAWGLAKRMVEVSPLLSSRIDTLATNLNSAETGAKLEPLSADANTMDGLNVHACIVDELHMHKDSRILDLMETATVARRQPFLFIITTAGVSGEDFNVCWQNHDYGIKILDRVVEDDSYFVFIACPSLGENGEVQWEKPQAWAEANPGLGVSVQEDQLAERARRAHDMPAERNKFLRYYLNVWTTRTERWIPPEVWSRQTKRHEEASLKRRVCYGGLDLASTRDVTALELFFPDEDGDGGDVLSHFWMPEDGLAAKIKQDRVRYDLWAAEGYLTLTPGNVTDYTFIEAEIMSIMEEFALHSIAYDPHNAMQIATRLSDAGVLMVRFSQGYGRMAAPTKEVDRLLLLNGIRHGGHPVLAWMASNCEVKFNSEQEMKIVKPKMIGPGARQSQKVDGMVALVMSVGAWMQAEPAELEEPNVYTELRPEGFRSL